MTVSLSLRQRGEGWGEGLFELERGALSWRTTWPGEFPVLDDFVGLEVDHKAANLCT